MKKAILAILLIAGFSAVTNAQTKTKEKTDSEKMKSKMKMPDGVMMVDGKPVQCKHNKCTPLTTTYSCTDGCKISTDGTVTKPDGTSMKLMNGYQIGKDGKMSMIPHGQTGHVCTDSCPMHGKM
jgi:hypothetical protein